MQDQSRVNSTAPLLSETQRKVTDLERENFDLKMRIYYLNNGKSKGAATDDEAERIVNILHDRDMTYEQLRAANADAHNKVSELQAELALLKSRQEANETTYDHLLHKNQRMGTLQLEENLKRERQAAQAIAQHDAALIAKYEKEIERLSDIHNADASLISECADRVAELMRVIEEKNKALENKSQALEASHKQNDVLADRLSKQEVLLIKNEAFHQSNAISSLARSILPPPVPALENTSRPEPHWSHPVPSNASYATAPNGSTGRNNPMAFPLDRTRNGTPAARQTPTADGEVIGLTESIRPAPKLGVPFMSGSAYVPNSSHHNGSTQQQHHYHSPLSGTVSGVPTRRERTDEGAARGPSVSVNSARDDLREDTSLHETPLLARSVQFSSHSPSPSQSQPMGKMGMSTFDSRYDASIDIENKPKSVLYRELQACKNELETVKAENVTLRDNIAADRALIKTQEKTLEHVRASAEEITLLEAEEIARLEAELERVSEERDRWASSAKKYESQLELMKYGNHGIFNSDRGRMAHSSPTRDRSRSPTRGISPSRQHRPATTTTGARATSPRLGSSGKSSGGGGGDGRSKVPHAKQNSDMALAESAIIEMYRKREAELLDALEGVVKRCHELESQLSLH